jgi:hypothetical protein
MRANIPEANKSQLGILAWMPAFAGMTRWVKASAGWYDTP